MDKRYELHCRTDPVFYDSPLIGLDGSEPDFDLGRRAVPAGWARMERAGWVVYRPVSGSLPDQGWKIHVSACLHNAVELLEKTGDYCLSRNIAFKFLRSRSVLHLHNAKYADRGSSGKFIAIYPADEDQLETTLKDLGEMLDGQRGPDVLSDLRYGTAPLHVRYGGIAERHCVSEEGRVEPAIADPKGTLVPDRRMPVFAPPSWVTLPAFLRPHLAAIQGDGTRSPDSADAALPYHVDSVLGVSNGGGVYLARDRRTGESVVLKEARPHAGLDACGADAVTRLACEREALERLAGLGVAPELRAHLAVGGRHFLVLEHVPGEPLSRVFGARYPLGSARTANLGDYVEWVTAICAKVEDAVTRIHESGLVYGGLNLADIMVRPDGGITLVDFETAGPIAEAGGTGLGDPAFAAPPGITGLDIDRYALACLRFALFLPVTELFQLDPGKAAEVAEVICGLFPVRQSFLRSAARIVGGGESRRTPAMVTWRQMRASMTEAILASATPERPDRLFPGDVAQFDGDGLGLAHGAAGVLYALHVTGAGRFPDHEQWLLDRARKPGEGARLGFYDGLHGVAHAVARLGHHEAALEVLDIVAARPWRALGTDLYGGLSGIGLNQICLGDLDEALNTAGMVADRLPRRVPEISGGAGPYAGLMYGSSGPALLFLRLYEKTGDVQWLDQAERALRQDLSRCVLQADGSLQVNEGWRTMPYLDRGSVGVSWVLGEFLHYRSDPELAAAREPLDRAARSHFYLQPGLFTGRAGIIAYLCRDRAGGWGREDPEAARQLAAMSWHALGYQGHLAFPGERLLRLSMDLATGTAGVLLAAGTALHGEPVGLPFLCGAMPANTLGGPGRSRVEV